MSDDIDLPDLIAALGEPQAYAHPVRALRVVQTHASCVFLTGDYAYKIKKPVDFGFLDYSTLEKRRHCCERELLLNRRLCPEVYLDVIPVGWHDGRLRMAAPGPAVEWAVRMLQLPEEDMLPSRLSAGTASRADIERIAEKLAVFHGSAATGPAVDAFGSPEAISRNVEENFSQTERRVGDALPPEHLTATRDYSRRFLTEQRAILLARVSEGRIRDGHGDLRAQNICLHAGIADGIQILDAIEFNDRFRCGDVAADLAYLSMDLDLAGRADLRQALVDRYVALSGDEGPRQLMTFYRCYRAYVRGKIALLAAEEIEIPMDERRAQEELAARAFDLSRSYAERRGHPALLIMSGYSGSGKSVLARELARRLGAMRLATDEVRKELAGVPVTSRLPPEHYAPERRQAVHEELRRRAEVLLARGEHVILDGTFLAREERDDAAALAAAHGADLWLIECHCPEAVMRKRLRERARSPGASDADLSVLDAQLQAAASSLSAEQGPAGATTIAVDTDQPAPLAARHVLHELRRASPGVQP